MYVHQYEKKIIMIIKKKNPQTKCHILTTRLQAIKPSPAKPNAGTGASSKNIYFPQQEKNATAMGTATILSLL